MNRTAGTITQAGVPDGFRTLVPIYVDLGDSCEAARPDLAPAAAIASPGRAPRS
jgi:hypothetical protein